MQKNHYEMSAVATAQIEIDFLRDEVKRLNEKLKNVAVARAFLRSEGFFTETLWSVHDVLETHDCSRGKAYEVLEKVMSNEGIVDIIFVAINDMCSDLEIKKIND